VSYYQLADIYRVARQEQQAEEEDAPTACPNDGQPLLPGPDGELFCNFDGWRPGGRYVGDDRPPPAW
jgi:hypothetical protein